MDVPETDSEDEIPPGWEERCTADGLVFYAHHYSRQTQWTHPRTGKKKIVLGELPYGWERKIEKDGKIVFENKSQNKITFTDPRLAFAVEETLALTDLRQRFDSFTTGQFVMHGKDLSGRVAIVTGANSGIGFETARSLALSNCTVVFACRCFQRGKLAIAKVKREKPSAKCYFLCIDLTSLHSVKNFSREFLTEFKTCDILILNAGVYGLAYTVTENHLETHFQVNYLSQFYLTLLLQPSMCRVGMKRVVFVSSEAHRFSSLSGPQDITESILSPPRRKYLATVAYNNSKLLMVFGALEMHRRFNDLGLKCYAVHPGNMVSSSLSRHWFLYKLLFFMVRPFTKTLQQACAPVLYCAASSDVENCSGIYVNNCVPCMPSKKCFDVSLSSRIWLTSLNIIENCIGRGAFY